MDERKMKWDCGCGMFALITFLKSGAREFATIKIDKFVGTKIGSSKTKCWFQKPLLYSKKHLREKFKFQGLIFPIVSSKIMLSLRDSTHSS